MSKYETYEKLIGFLDENNADYREIDHEEEGRTDFVSKMRGNEVKDAAKCIILIVKLGKKDKKYVLGIVPGDAKINLDFIKAKYKAKYIAFATPEIAEELTGCVPGTILPFDLNNNLEVIVDPLVLKSDPELFFNSARLDKSLALKTSSYKEIIEKEGKAQLENIALYESEGDSENKKKDDPLSNQRHSLAHLLAAAVLDLYPNSKLTLGPAVDNGFYYDIDLEEQISDEDLQKIEDKMKELLPNWNSFEEKEVTKEEALEFYKDNEYKKELIEEISERGEKITLHTSGDFTDLCRGGHIDNMSTIDPDSFKLDKVAGAYWRGDENNKMLTRIYGLAFNTKEELESYVTLREEAKERDHRKLGKELDLFTFSEKVGSGLPLFTPKGTALRNAIVDKIYQIQDKYNYEQVWIPHITKPDLYKTSGHWEKFGDELFKVQGKESEFVMKPMNCPHHTQIYASQPRSYKDLPLRYTESTTVYRDEQSGELLGLGRVRSITQDDGHVFCTPEQVEEEIEIIANIIEEFYTALGVWNDGDYWVSVSTRDKDEPEKYLGSDEIWDSSEKILEEISKKRGYEYKVVSGEAAFYGPKIDFMFKDSLGRERQLATIQLDFNMPSRFELEYTDKEGKKQTPVMLHRAIAGSLERFLSIFIEHFGGNFPLWMSPEQVKIIPINTEVHGEFAEEIHKQLRSENIRTSIDNSSDGFGKKVRKAKTEKVPIMLIIGDKELESKKVTVEYRDSEENKELTAEELIKEIKKSL